MRKPDDLFFWEINTRIRKITEFKLLVKSYFEKISYNDYSLEYEDTDETTLIRSQLNIKCKEIQDYVESVISPIITYYPAPAVGGFVTDINLLDNIFYLHRYQILSQSVLDILEKAIGIYQKEAKSAIVRTFNPFIWLGRALDIATSIPFQLLGSLGFNKTKMEQSSLGKFSKYLMKVGVVIFGGWEVLYRFGLVPDQINIVSILGRFF